MYMSFKTCFHDLIHETSTDTRHGTGTTPEPDAYRSRTGTSRGTKPKPEQDTILDLNWCLPQTRPIRSTIHSEGHKMVPDVVVLDPNRYQTRYWTWTGTKRSTKLKAGTDRYLTRTRPRRSTIRSTQHKLVPDAAVLDPNQYLMRTRPSPSTIHSTGHKLIPDVAVLDPNRYQTCYWTRTGTKRGIKPKAVPDTILDLNRYLTRTRPRCSTSTEYELVPYAVLDLNW